MERRPSTVDRGDYRGKSFWVICIMVITENTKIQLLNKHLFLAHTKPAADPTSAPEQLSSIW